MENCASPCKPKCRSPVWICLLLCPIVNWDFKAVVFVFKDFDACENRTSAERDVGRSCAIVFVSAYTQSENCSDQLTSYQIKHLSAVS